MLTVLSSGHALLTIWGEDTTYDGVVLPAGSGQTKCFPGWFSPPNGYSWASSPAHGWQKTFVERSTYSHRPRYLQLLESPEGREQLEMIAPVSVTRNGREEWDVDIAYLNDLEEWRQRLLAGTLTSLELRRSDELQMESFINYLVLLKDWKALKVYFAGLLKVNIGLALLLRSKVRDVQARELNQWFKRTRFLVPLKVLTRPRPPTAPLAPPAV